MKLAPARAALLAACSAWALGACALASGPGAAGDPQAARCDATAVQALVGQAITDALAESARRQAGADTVRTVRHDQMVTKEFRQGRLTLWLDEQGRVRQVNCG